MLVQTILVVISTASGIIGTLLKDPPASVKAVLVTLLVLGGLATVAKDRTDEQTSAQTRNWLSSLIIRFPKTSNGFTAADRDPQFNLDLERAVYHVVNDHGSVLYDEAEPNS